MKTWAKEVFETIPDSRLVEPSLDNDNARLQAFAESLLLMQCSGLRDCQSKLASHFVCLQGHRLAGNVDAVR